MATTTNRKEIINNKWSLYYQLELEVGWYDIILFNGDKCTEVYYEHDYFHFPNSSPSVPRKEVQWIRLHSK